MNECFVVIEGCDDTGDFSSGFINVEVFSTRPAAEEHFYTCVRENFDKDSDPREHIKAYGKALVFEYAGNYISLLTRPIK